MKRDYRENDGENRLSYNETLTTKLECGFRVRSDFLSTVVVDRGKLVSVSILGQVVLSEIQFVSKVRRKHNPAPIPVSEI